MAHIICINWFSVVGSRVCPEPVPCSREPPGQCARLLGYSFSMFGGPACARSPSHAAESPPGSARVCWVTASACLGVPRVPGARPMQPRAPRAVRAFAGLQLQHVWGSRVCPEPVPCSREPPGQCARLLGYSFSMFGGPACARSPSHAAESPPGSARVWWVTASACLGVPRVPAARSMQPRAPRAVRAFAGLQLQHVWGSRVCPEPVPCSREPPGQCARLLGYSFSMFGGPACARSPSHAAESPPGSARVCWVTASACLGVPRVPGARPMQPRGPRAVRAFGGLQVQYVWGPAYARSLPHSAETAPREFASRTIDEMQRSLDRLGKRAGTLSPWLTVGLEGAFSYPESVLKAVILSSFTSGELSDFLEVSNEKLSAG
ncbi:uncharacterized protein ACOB8E_004389 isoform 1-T6 [Sarcophilus harrisii]